MTHQSFHDSRNMSVESNEKISDVGDDAAELAERSIVEGNIDAWKDIFTGRIFNSIEDAHFCYNQYAANNGFSIRKKGIERRFPDVSDISSVRFTCSCEGIYKRKVVEDGDKPKRRTSTMKCGCLARMRIKKNNTNCWKVTVFEDNQNHAMVTPSKRILMKSYKYVPTVAKDLSEAFYQEGIQINKVTSLFGGCSKIPFNNKDIYNHLKKVRNEYNESGDAQAVKEYFEQKRRENNDFYYAIDIDKKGRAVNFFWIDGRSRLACQQFGDVITFDTTFKTNKYSMPFGPFTGINHHHQSILFGCALLEREIEENFVWVFQHWLQAMFGRYPVSIITDQDRAIGNVVENVFPHSRHRLCLWHIKKKFAEKLKHIYFEKSTFKKALKQCVRYSHTTEEFEEKWSSLVEKYELQENTWMNDLYEIRHKWVPIFCRNTFFGGMNTTQRSESINSFFDGFLTPRINLKQFVERYDKALETIYVNERREDYVSIYKKRVLMSKDDILLHASNIYTRNMFDRFEMETNEWTRLKADEVELDGDVKTYIVCYKNEEIEKYVVKMNLTTEEGSCGCQLFEFLGLPCKHLIRVFDQLCFTQIPSNFILKRWTKDANRTEIKALVDVNLVSHDHNVGKIAARTSFLVKAATQCAYMASTSDEGYKLCVDTLHNLFEKLRSLNDASLVKEYGPTSITIDSSCSDKVEQLLLNPNISLTKGRKMTNQGVEIDMSNNNERIKVH